MPSTSGWDPEGTGGEPRVVDGSEPDHDAAAVLNDGCGASSEFV